METSIYNLTKPECSALVHFSAEKMEVWQLVRLEQPAEAEALPTPADPAAAAPPAEVPELPVPQN
jgi:hypothetical protein